MKLDDVKTITNVPMKGKNEKTSTENVTQRWKKFMSTNTATLVTNTLKK